MIKKCKQCKIKEVNRRSKLFCSYNCYWQSKIGIKPIEATLASVKIRTGVPRTEELKNKLRQKRILRKQQLGYINSSETIEKIRQSNFNNPRMTWLNQKGENHPAYKKDRSSLKKQNRHGDSANQEWAKNVKKRDGWKCKIEDKNCVRQKIAHHILSWRDYPELRYEINNGITLCKFHHPLKFLEVEMLSPFFQQLISQHD